ncbi:MAG: alpha/beta hydrolase [Cryomorphaceae bacterium]
MSFKNTFVHIASSLFPTYFTKKAFKFLVNPQVRILRRHELEVLEQARQEDFPFQDYTIKTYTWNEGNEPILLVHGWEGQAGNFADLIAVLVGKGYTVHSFDGPSHGFSSKGSASIMEFTQLVGVMIRRLKVKKLVSHSFGSVATTYALYQNRDLEIDKYALLTTPDRFTQRVDQISAQVGISQKVKHRLIEKLEKEFNLKAAELNVSDWVKEINVKSACIWHDRTDKVIPIFQSETVNEAWPESELRITENTGHFRILRTEDIIHEVVDFLD